METLRTTEKQRNQVKDFIQTELLKRGFLAPIIKFEENKQRLEFVTSEFQTTPVLFKSIVVENFSSEISALKTYKEDPHPIFYREIWIQVHVSYDHFTGGSNGCSLFTVTGTLIQDGEVFDLEAK